MKNITPKEMGFILTIVLLLIICQTSLVESNLNSPQNETINKAESTTQKQESTPDVLAMKQTPTTKKSQQTGTKNQRETYIKSPDERIATFTGWLVIVAFIQALIFIAQAIAMSIQAKHLRRTVEATEKSVQAVIRMELPIIQAIPGGLVDTNKLIGDDEPYGGAISHLPSKYSAFCIRRFKNYGRSPAFLEMISVGWMVADTLPNQPQYIKTSTLNNDCVITSGDEFDPNIHYGIELTDDELQGTIEGSLWLWFYGCLYYRDFMNEKREYRFCWRLANHNHKTMKPYYFFSSDGNPPKSYTKNV